MSRRGAGAHLKRTCPFCSKTFKRSDHLTIHIRTHTGERPYGCPYCPHRSAQRSGMAKHLKSHAKRALRCNHCPFVAASPQELHTHTARVHPSAL